jgi:hypothetical protein
MRRYVATLGIITWITLVVAGPARATGDNRALLDLLFRTDQTDSSMVEIVPVIGLTAPQDPLRPGPRDMSFYFILSVNGAPADTTLFLATASDQEGGSEGPCGVAGCHLCFLSAGEYSGIYPCTNDGGGGCLCGGILPVPMGGSEPLVIGDELIARIEPAPGSAPDKDASDDFLIVLYDGLTPTPVGDRWHAGSWGRIKSDYK